MTIQLPALLPLREAWAPDVPAQWRELTVHARSLSGRATDLIVGDRRHVLAGLLRSGDAAGVRHLLADAAYVTALASLWSEPEGEFEATVSTDLLDAMRERHSRVSRLARGHLLTVFFMRFDRLDDGLEDSARRPLDALADLLARDSPLYGDFDSTTFARDAPEQLASIILDAEVDVASEVKRRGLARYRGGRFLDLLDHALYLERLRRIPFGEPAHVLDELRDAAVHRAPHRFGRMLGHAALEILIDRAGADAPGREWAEFVLTIAGDPRMTHSESYAEWWSVLGAERAATVTAWIARGEIEIFLEYLREIARRDEAMNRQFPPRKHLLEGLVRAGVVRRSRLILAPDVRVALRAALPKGGMDASAELRGGGNRMRAIIYLDCGDFHLIEGSHNTRLFLYMGVPSPRIIDPRTRSFEYDSLTKDIPERFESIWRATGSRYVTGVEDVWHQGIWQRRVVDFLRLRGIDIDPALLMDANSYRKLVFRGEITGLRRTRVEPLTIEEVTRGLA